MPADSYGLVLGIGGGLVQLGQDITRENDEDAVECIQIKFPGRNLDQDFRLGWNVSTIFRWMAMHYLDNCHTFNVQVSS